MTTKLDPRYFYIRKLIKIGESLKSIRESVEWKFPGLEDNEEMIQKQARHIRKPKVLKE